MNRSRVLNNIRPSATVWRLGVAAALGLGCCDCLYLEYVVYRFELSGCPDSTFALVDSAQSGSQRLRLEPNPGWHPDCPAFKAYDFAAEKVFSQDGIFVSFRRGPSCQLLVALRYDKQMSSEPVDWAHSVARLSLGAKATSLSMTLVGKELVGARKAFQVWCTRPQEIAALTPGTVPRCTQSGIG